MAAPSRAPQHPAILLIIVQQLSSNTDLGWDNGTTALVNGLRRRLVVGDLLRMRPFLLARPEHEFAVAFKRWACPHVELSVFADEKQGTLGDLLRTLQQQLCIVGAHLVGKRLAVL